MGLSENETRVAFIVLKNSLVNLGGCPQVQTAALLAGLTSVNVFDKHAENLCWSAFSAVYTCNSYL